MASNRQVRNWIVECLRQHLAPDALKVAWVDGDDELVVYTRKAGTVDKVGGVFLVSVRRVG